MSNENNRNGLMDCLVKRVAVSVLVVVFVMVSLSGCVTPPTETTVGALNVNPDYIAPISGCWASVEYKITPYDADRDVLLTITDPNGRITNLSSNSNRFDDYYLGNSPAFNGGLMPGLYTFNLTYDGEWLSEGVYVIRPEGEWLSHADIFHFPYDPLEGKSVRHSFLLTNVRVPLDDLKKEDMTTEMVLCTSKYMQLTKVAFLSLPQGGWSNDEINVAVEKQNGEWINIGQLEIGDTVDLIPLSIEDNMKMHVTLFRDNMAPDFYHGESIAWELGLYFKGF